MSLIDAAAESIGLRPAGITAQLLVAAERRGTYRALIVFLVCFVNLSRDLQNLRITSWLEPRSDPESQHNVGTAMDFGVRTAAELADAEALASRWRELGLTAIREYDPPHMHVQLWPAGVAAVTNRIGADGYYTDSLLSQIKGLFGVLGF